MAEEVSQGRFVSGFIRVWGGICCAKGSRSLTGLCWKRGQGRENTITLPVWLVPPCGSVIGVAGAVRIC